MTVIQEIKNSSTYRWDEEAKAFVVYYPELNIYTQGETEERARDAIVDAVFSFLLVSYRKDHAKREKEGK